MKDDTVSRAAVMQSLTREYNRRRTGDGLKLAWIEKAVNEVPAAQTCEDAVSRADVLETYADLYDVFEDSKAICKELHKVYDRINALPAVQPQPEEDCDTCKHGFFGSRQCDNCRVRYPSHYEREEEQHGSD